MKDKAIIELFGLPGSGKTTCRQTLINQLKLKGIKVYSQDEFANIAKARYAEKSNLLKKLISKVMFKLEKKRILKIFKQTHYEYNNFVLKTLREINNSSKKTLKRYLEKTMIQYQLFDYYGFDNEIMLIDEGMVHRAHTIYGYDINFSLAKDKIIDYLNVIPYIGTVIYVQVDKKVAKNRVLNRGLPNRMISFSESDLNDFYSLNEKLVDVIDEFFKQYSNDYFIIKNDSTNRTGLNLDMKRFIKEIQSNYKFERSQ